jgi:hypothetical protein
MPYPSTISVRKAKPMINASQGGSLLLNQHGPREKYEARRVPYMDRAAYLLKGAWQPACLLFWPYSYMSPLVSVTLARRPGCLLNGFDHRQGMRRTHFLQERFTGNPSPLVSGARSWDPSGA